VSTRITFDKDPAAELVYGFDVAGRLATGKTVTAATASVPSGSTLTLVSAGYSGTQVYCRVTGGTVGRTEPVTLQWTTDGSPADVDQHTLWLKIIER
jgi:hypothetical protein